MKPQKRLRKRPIAHHSRAGWILSSLVEPLEVILERGAHPSMILRYGVDGANAILNAKERRLRRQEFERLRKRKLIEVSKEADCYRVALTQRGKQEAFRLKVLEADLLPDDRMCMVVFDIPESKRKLRKELRSFLTSAGFAPIQKSVWISRFDAGEALRELFRSTGASKWVRVYTAISG